MTALGSGQRNGARPDHTMFLSAIWFFDSLRAVHVNHPFLLYSMASISFHVQALLPILAGGTADQCLKLLAEIAFARVADLIGDLLNRHIRCAQQQFGSMDALIDQIIIGGDAGLFFKQPDKMKF